MSDEHRADVAGFAGNSAIRTPTLDALAKDAVIFRNAYTPSPICIPARQSMMIGQLPRTCGVEHYGQDLPPFSNTFAKHLARHAYVSVAAGKLHHNGPDYLQGWTDRLGSEWTYFERQIDGKDEGAYEKYRPRPTDYKWSDRMECLKAGTSSGKYQVLDRYTVQGTLDFLDRFYADELYDRSTPDWPLLLKVSLVQPHYPYICDSQRMRYYLNRVTPYVESEAFDHPFLSQRQVRPGVDASATTLRRATAAYYGMVEQVDEHYGDVLSRLRELGEDLDDWIIIYTSDHGEMLGEHGIWEKQKFFEASARVPLMIRWPRRFAPRVVDENVNLCDLYATLCDLTGIPIPAGLDSRSMVPLMRGESESWHKRYRDETISQFGARNLMIKWGALKYQWYGTEMPEVLFDLAADPGERRNAIADPQHAAVVEGFRARRDALGFSPAGRGAYVNAGYA